MKTDYHAKYYAYELTKKCSSESLEKFAKTLSEAKVQLNPHQIDAALFAFKSPFSKGAILADEVGLGKTIEAGIVISQYWAERKRNILIIMPSSLRKQWSQELEEKFFIPSIILETKSFNSEIKNGNLNPFEQDKIVICSYNFAKNKGVYIKAIDWDLVVIDEAHRLRNVYKKSNKISNVIKESIAEKNKILLTATPLQNSLLELYGLVSIIDDYTFGDLPSFKAQYCKSGQQVDFQELKDRIKPVCQRTLRRQVKEYIKYTNRVAITEDFVPTEQENELYKGISEYLLRDRLYALPNSQRKLMTLILRKLLASSTYAISATLGGLAKKLQNIIDKNNQAEEIYEEELENNYESYSETKEDWLDDEDDDITEEETEQNAVLSNEDIENIKEEKELLEHFYKLAVSIEENAKGKKLLTALNRGFEENIKRGGNKKALIFTESTRTQEYVKRILDREYNGKVVLFNGTNSASQAKEIYKNWLEKNKNNSSGSKTADTRAALVDYFKNEADIMIATEAAAEGINLQFCSIVVNYDLPWNPQRIEQRIGRCHRYGQKNDVVVVNFLNRKNAADVRVFELLSEKFKLFDGVFGASDEVLGAIGSGVDFEKRIAQILQSCRTEAQIKQSFDDLQKEMESEIDEKMLETRKKLFENFDQEVTEKLKFNKQKTSEYLDRFEKLLWELTRYKLENYADFNSEKLSFNLCNQPYDDTSFNLETYTFNKEQTDFIQYRISHPLAQKILASSKEKSLPVKELVFDYSNTKDKKISVIENFIGKSGWLLAKVINVKAFEEEENIILAGLADDGTIIESEFCKKFFALPAIEQETSSVLSDKALLNDKIEEEKQKLLSYISNRNAKFFDEELTKLDKWAEDRKNSIEIALKQLDKDIKTQKTEAKKIIQREEN